jgi:hypothetical protein
MVVLPETTNRACTQVGSDTLLLPLHLVTCEALPHPRIQIICIVLFSTLRWIPATWFEIHGAWRAVWMLGPGNSSLSRAGTLGMRHMHSRSCRSTRWNGPQGAYILTNMYVQYSRRSARWRAGHGGWLRITNRVPSSSPRGFAYKHEQRLS